MLPRKLLTALRDWEPVAARGAGERGRRRGLRRWRLGRALPAGLGRGRAGSEVRGAQASGGGGHRTAEVARWMTTEGAGAERPSRRRCGRPAAADLQVPRRSVRSAIPGSPASDWSESRGRR